MKHSIPGAQAPFVHPSYNDPKQPMRPVGESIIRTFSVHRPLERDKDGSRDSREPLC